MVREFANSTSSDDPPRRGSVTVPRGVLPPREHELATARRLAAHGFHITFRPVDNTPGAKNPDVDIDGHAWEMKSPRGASVNSTISGQFTGARGQADRLIIDLARCGLADDIAVPQIARRFNGQKRFVRVLILDHEGKLIALPNRE